MTRRGRRGANDLATARAARTVRRTPAVGLLTLVALLALAASPADAQATLGEARDEAMRGALVGTWIGEIGTVRVELRLGEDGSYRLGGERGTYRVEAGTVVLETDPVRAYAATFSGRDSVAFTGGDLASPLQMSRSLDTASVVASSVRVNPHQIVDKLVSIGIILAIVVASRIIVALLKATSRVLIVSERGPLRYIYRTEKNRTQTVHSLTLDVLKYVIYFTALGFMLSEIGVNYTAYLASLSVIGLAIGFGSQGLVQDVVTGFFLVFEGQFNVGDMVEISGQAGRVREMGLRMTRLESYTGQIVYVPNRNIAVVGRYLAGALTGFVDFRVEASAAPERVGELCRETVGVLSTRFPGVFLGDPKPAAIGEPEGAWRLVRVHFAVWPGQQWAVEQQLAAALRASLQAAGMEYDAESFVTCYRDREEYEVSPRARSFVEWRRSLREPER